MRLAYKAVTRDGKIMRGIIDAKDINEAAGYLRSKELLPVNITEKRDSELLKFIPFFKKSSGADLVLFTRELSSMITSGLTLMQGLRILKEQMQSQRMKEIIDNVMVDIEDGSNLSTALAKYPEVFGSVYISLIKAAEVSGLLDKILERLADNLEKAQKLRATIKGALIYPIVVMIGIVLVMSIMMIFVVPTLEPLYEGLGVTLPLPTIIVIAISHFMVNFWLLILGVIVIAAFLFRRWKSTETGRLMYDDFILRLPIFGKLLKLMAITELTRTLGLLVGAGVLIVDALNETAGVSGNLLYKNAMFAVSKSVEKGVTAGEAFSFSPLFPSMVVEMVKVGEQTGKLDASLLKLAEYFEREVDQIVKNLTTLMEPFIIAILGAGIAFLLISVILPIYSLVSAIH